MVAEIQDGDILALVRAGDRDGAVRLLLGRDSGAVWNHCRRLLQDGVAADDVHQQVFIEAHRDLERFRGDSKLRTWLFGIASHRCADALRSRRRSDKHRGDAEAIDDVAADAPLPVERLERADRLRALEQCLDHLAAEARAAVLMRFRAGMSYDEMSDAVADKADTLRARVARALPLLRRCLERKGIEL